MADLVFMSEFKKLAEDEKPREKLAKYGPQALSLWELVALILRTGERHKGGHFEDVMQLSKRLVSECGFRGLFNQKDSAELKNNHNIHKGHAEIIVAISEIQRRLHGRFDSFDASEPSKIFEKFKALQKAKQEQCFVLHLDPKKRCVYQEMVAVGQANSVVVYPNDVLRTPIWIGTKEIIIIHNHRGQSKASKADIAWTLALVKGAWSLHQIKVSDHIIIGEDGYFSFIEKDLL